MLNVAISGYQYIVYDTCDPLRRRYLVGNGKRCTCGQAKCEHSKEVVYYLKKGGKRAPVDSRPTYQQRIERIRALREAALEAGNVSDSTKALELAISSSCEADRTAYLETYALPQQRPL